MADGDIALAAGMDIVDSEQTDARTIGNEINKSRDYIIEFGLPDVVPVANGGTGAQSAAQARANLGLQATVNAVAGATASPDADTLMQRGTGGRVNVGAPSAPSNAATKSYVDDEVATRTTKAYVDAAVAGRFPSNGGTMTGELAVLSSFYLPNASPAVSGYSVAYINSDGRVSRGASSERYKKFISAIEPESLGDIWPQLVRYQMRGGDSSWKYGYIAERLAESDDLRPFVVYNAEEQPDSIDFVALLMAQNAQLHQQLGLLAQRIATLEERTA